MTEGKRKKINTYLSWCFKCSAIMKNVLWKNETKPSSKELIIKFSEAHSTQKCVIAKSSRLKYLVIGMFWELKYKWNSHIIDTSNPVFPSMKYVYNQISKVQW